jgi:uncharacterized membrane protein YjfL (UPF0719 family)
MSNQIVGLISGVVHIFLSLFLALIATYGSFRVFSLLNRTIDEVHELRSKNTAVGILLAGMILSSAIIVREATLPIISTLQGILFTGISPITFLYFIGFLLGFSVLAALVAMGSIWTAMNIFMRLTHKLNEITEIRNNNTAVAIALAVTIVVMGIFLADGISTLLSALIPLRAFRPIEVM